MLHQATSLLLVSCTYVLVGFSDFAPVDSLDDEHAIGTVQQRQGEIEEGILLVKSFSDGEEGASDRCPSSYDAAGLGYQSSNDEGFSSADLDTWGADSFGAFLLLATREQQERNDRSGQTAHGHSTQM